MDEPSGHLQSVDLLVVGGGINGAGISRDAAGRGLSVLLVEQDDLASHTSSASTKLIHGGLRYLEYGELRLVREALVERERLWGMAPHLIHPLSFVLPQMHSPRPVWMVRLGLFAYDHLGGRKHLPATRTVDLARSPLGTGLRPGAGKGFVYADCRVDDARLVIANAQDARARGAQIRTRTRLVAAKRVGPLWRATVEADGVPRAIHARALVNAAGPWVEAVLGLVPDARRDRGVRLVKGSHIVVPRLYPGDHAFLLQNSDKRVVFTIPYEGSFTLVGTTDQPWEGPPGPAAISAPETAYLCATVNAYFARGIAPADVVWSYAGIRPLYDDHASSASAVTRDYVLDLDGDGDATSGRAPMLSVFGGKITTYRRLAEQALDRLAPFFPAARPAWTAGATLPGGDTGDFPAFAAAMSQAYQALPSGLVARLAAQHGTAIHAVLGNARTLADLGHDFGGGLTEAELDYLRRQEWAATAEDVLWRRTKLGLHLPASVAPAIDAWFAKAR
jgi:glycerol-3-phosphate dehydrogenase